MQIGIGLNQFSYTPEAYAYADYLTKKGWIVQLEQENQLDPSLDLHLYFMGLKPFWKNDKNKCKSEIHEYQSLSTPPYAHLKNIIKNFSNRKPNGRIFLNHFLFKDKIPSINRDMGIDKNLFIRSPRKPIYDLIYSGSIAGRPGLIEELLRLAKINLKILIVGSISNEERNLTISNLLEELKDMNYLSFTNFH